jgi:hypothetical protein
VFEGPFAKPLTAGIGKPDIVLLGRPVDARKPALVLMHVIFPAVTFEPPRHLPVPVLELKGAFFPLGFISRPAAGAHVQSRRSPETGAQGQNGCSQLAARFGKAAPIRWRRLCFVPLRFTSQSLHAVAASKSPQNGTGSKASLEP